MKMLMSWWKVRVDYDNAVGSRDSLIQKQWGYLVVFLLDGSSYVLLLPISCDLLQGQDTAGALVESAHVVLQRGQ